MRIVPALLAVILAGAAVSVAVRPGRNGSGGCGERRACIPTRLPAPVTIVAGSMTGGAGYRIDRRGRVHRGGGIASPFPRDASWFPSTGVWFSIRSRHLVVGRRDRRLWRSREEIDSPWQLGVVTVGSHTVAFQHDHRLYLAPLAGAERPVARRELPLGWTGRGLYTYRYHGRQLALRSDAGALLAIIARRPLGSDFFVAHGSLYFIVHGVLMVAHGPRIRPLASLARLGLSANPWLQPAGRLLALQDNRRLVVVRADGSRFASIPLPRIAGQEAGISGPLVANADASAVAFTATSGEPAQSGDTTRTQQTEALYVLRAGARAAVRVHTERIAGVACAGGVDLEWHGGWLLDNAAGGQLAAIQTTGARRTIVLGGLVKRLAETPAGFSAHWS